MEDLSSQIEEHMHSFHRLAGYVKDIGCALLFSNQRLPSAAYNHATRVRAAESEADKLIADVIRYYQSIGVKACFMLYPTTRPTAFADVLLKAKFELIDEEDAMLFMRKTAIVKRNPNVQVTEIDRRQLDVWTKVLMRGYGLPEGFRSVVQEMFTRVSRYDGSRFYQAYCQDKPVGSCLLYSFDDIATIYTVATVPEQTKKGVATSLINRAVTDSLKAGCNVLYLLAGKGSDAERLYGKLGFERVFSRKLYEFHPKKQK